jgi:hypothetical protein
LILASIAVTGKELEAIKKNLLEKAKGQPPALNVIVIERFRAVLGPGTLIAAF